MADSKRLIHFVKGKETTPFFLSILLTQLQPKPLCIAIQAEISGDERTKLLPPTTIIAYPR